VLFDEYFALGLACIRCLGIFRDVQAAVEYAKESLFNVLVAQWWGTRRLGFGISDWVTPAGRSLITAPAWSTDLILRSRR